jgi:hypothetical protein
MAGALKIWNAATSTWDYVGRGARGPAGTGGGGTEDGELHLTPKVTPLGSRATVFYSSVDEHIWVVIPD